MKHLAVWVATVSQGRVELFARLLVISDHWYAISGLNAR